MNSQFVTQAKMPNDSPVKYSQESGRVRRMFGRIAWRYDLTNSMLSMGAHKIWRLVLLRMLPRSKNQRVLDLCTGTGDLIPLLSRKGNRVVGADFCHPMLEQAAMKRFAASRTPETPGCIALLQGDALRLPFANDSFDVVTVSFGVRNFENTEDGLREVCRVLRPQGRLLVLEFGQPDSGPWAWLFRVYSKYCIPLIGGALTGDREAYEYLPETSAHFPCGTQFELLLLRAGFSPIKTKPLFGGIAYAYSAAPDLNSRTII